MTTLIEFSWGDTECGVRGWTGAGTAERAGELTLGGCRRRASVQRTNLPGGMRLRSEMHGARKIAYATERARRNQGASVTLPLLIVEHRNGPGSLPKSGVRARAVQGGAARPSHRSNYDIVSLMGAHVRVA